ncbi:O-antigen ligase [Streptomyces sp. XD-27]|uniref:O-antigen ligase family protein n=1 Tax=Streptomyces sp. XD-27 TaxID=3062779 RepID=UPI0026F43FD3|nr:O-antigen ligase family protein [Streptomyces sp. XD-27]WKX73644.1 O-antigen ligase family protein [Streptomyces sp. XD-27]
MRGGASDTAGVLILGGCAIWALVSAAGRAARPEGVLLAVLAVAAGYACGRMAGALLPVAATAATALAGLALTSTTWITGVDGGPAGRSGADAAQLILAAGAACCAAWATRRPVLRLGLGLLAAGVAGAALAIGSVPACAAAAGVLLCSLAAGRMRHRLLGLAGLALVAAVAVGGCWAVAQNALPSGLGGAVQGQLTEHRIRLWQDAARIAEDHPVRGAGPDLYSELSPVARESAEPDGKPHSAPLQQAAEQGVPGMVLLAAAFGWLLYALWLSPRSTQVVLTAGAALTALAVAATLGNALSFPQVTAGAGLLAGLATAHVRAEDLP